MTEGLLQIRDLAKAFLSRRYLRGMTRKIQLCKEGKSVPGRESMQRSHTGNELLVTSQK